jgi:hypothetical protein
VALNTFWYFAVCIVAEGACKSGMLALVVAKFDYLLAVACKTWIRDVATHLYDER